MTQAEYARHRGVSKPAVTAWKKRGLLVMLEDPDTGKPKVDVARSDARVNANIDPGRGRPPSTEAATEAADQAQLPIAESPETGATAGGDSLQSVRMELIRHQTDGMRLKNAREAGQLVPLAELQRRAGEVGRAARERVHAWFFSVAERLAATGDARAIMALGEEGIDQVFAELAQAAELGEFAGDGDEVGDSDLPEAIPEEVISETEAA